MPCQYNNDLHLFIEQNILETPVLCASCFNDNYNTIIAVTKKLKRGL